MGEGANNFTRMLSFLALNFSDVNVGQRNEDGSWVLNAAAKNVNGKSLFELVDLCREIDAQPGFVAGGLAVLGRD